MTIMTERLPVQPVITRRRTDALASHGETWTTELRIQVREVVADAMLAEATDANELLQMVCQRMLMRLWREWQQANVIHAILDEFVTLEQGLGARFKGDSVAVVELERFRTALMARYRHAADLPPEWLVPIHKLESPPQ